MGNKLSYTDREIVEIDRKERMSKINEKYQPEKPDDVVRCLNQLNENISLLLVEMRRMCDILSYQIPTQKEE